MLKEDGDKLKVYILPKAANEGRLPPGTGDKLASYLGRTDYKALALIGQIIAAESSRDIRDLFVTNGLTINIEGEATEPEEPTNDHFTGVGAASQLQDGDFESLASRLTTDLAISTNNPKSPRAAEGGTPKLSKSRGRTSVPGYSSTNGPRRTDGASQAVERVAAASDADASTQSGIQGELFVYNTLKAALGPAFTHDSWTSELRHRALPELSEWNPPNAKMFFADFTFVDLKGELRAWLEKQDSMDQDYQWTLNDSGKPTMYHIEVKSTVGKPEDPYHISDWQFEEMKRMSQHGDEGTGDVIDKFILLRVGYVGSGSEKLLVVPDLWQALVDGECGVRAPGGLWIVYT
jgi:hypothetical protein